MAACTRRAQREFPSDNSSAGHLIRQVHRQGSRTKGRRCERGLGQSSPIV
mgnify:CR=1